MIDEETFCFPSGSSKQIYSNSKNCDPPQRNWSTVHVKIIKENYTNFSDGLDDVVRKENNKKLKAESADDAAKKKRNRIRTKDVDEAIKVAQKDCKLSKTAQLEKAKKIQLDTFLSSDIFSSTSKVISRPKVKADFLMEKNPNNKCSSSTKIKTSEPHDPREKLKKSSNNFTSLKRTDTRKEMTSARDKPPISSEKKRAASSEKSGNSLLLENSSFIDDEMERNSPLHENARTKEKRKCPLSHEERHSCALQSEPTLESISAHICQLTRSIQVLKNNYLPTQFKELLSLIKSSAVAVDSSAEREVSVHAALVEKMPDMPKRLIQEEIDFDVLSDLPLKSTKEIGKLDKRLGDQKYYINWINAVAYKSKKGAHITLTARNAMGFALHPSVCDKFTWVGQNRSTQKNKKYPFNALRLKDAILDASRLKHGNFIEGEVSESLTRWFSQVVKKHEKISANQSENNAGKKTDNLKQTVVNSPSRFKTSPCSLSHSETSHPSSSRPRTSLPSPSRSRTSGRNRSRSKSPLSNRSRTRTSLSNHSRSKSPLSNRSRSKSPLRNHSRSKSPLSNRSRTRTSLSNHSRSKSPLSNRSRSRSPLRNRSRSKSPLSNRSRSKSPLRNRSRSKSPLSNRSRSRSPLSTRSRSISPLSNRSRSRSPISNRSRSRSPISNRSRSRSPISNRSRSRSPISNHSCSRPSLNNRSRSKSPLTNRSRSRSPLSHPSRSRTSLSNHSRSRSRTSLSNRSCSPIPLLNSHRRKSVTVSSGKSKQENNLDVETEGKAQYNSSEKTECKPIATALSKGVSQSLLAAADLSV